MIHGGIMNEKTQFDFVKTDSVKPNLYIIGLFILFVWAISVSIAAGIFHHGRNIARSELAAIKEVPADEWLQSDINSISKRNAELEQFNRELSDELRAVSADSTKLAGIISSASRLAESGRQSLRDAGQSARGIAGTINELRDNYQRLANIVIAIERNYNAIIGELNKSAEMVGSN
jgi:hypothetical protein